MENGKHVTNSVIIVSNEDRFQKQNKNDRNHFDEEKSINSQMRSDLNKF